jgi:hypothetical protein
MSIDNIWNNLLIHENEKFYTKSGIEFIYEIRDNSIYPKPKSGSKIATISKSAIEQCLQFVPLKNTTPLQSFFAPSYIYALLTDERII